MYKFLTVVAAVIFAFLAGFFCREKCPMQITVPQYRCDHIVVTEPLTEEEIQGQEGELEQLIEKRVEERQFEEQSRDE